ncbi:hypothetical protein B0T14DRAFT_54394 [Immersiella caudata]|uniref:Uncharacterized protein n=1 Tax=Immersiella caudata TaxID=314043 RepID=A0AA40CBX9_9PEZI|nr:hypothetical protein B0T14DRAFT_54394 [Immersiella caudata]
MLRCRGNSDSGLMSNRSTYLLVALLASTSPCPICPRRPVSSEHCASGQCAMMDRPSRHTIGQRAAKHHLVPNYTHPPPEAQCPPSQDDQEASRDSLGSDCVPGMVEDHGSDISADDYEYQGAELWDSFWQSQMNARMSRASPYPALLSSPTTIREVGPEQHLSMEPRSQLHILQQNHAKDQQSTSSMPLFGTTTERQRSKIPRPRYSIFPPASPPGPPRSSLSRPRTGSITISTSQSSIDTQRSSVSSRGACSVNLTASPPKGPAALPKPTRSIVQATRRAATPTTGSPLIPFPALQSEASRPASRHKPLPDLPAQARPACRRPPLANLRKLSFSKITTNSAPSLARLAQTQAQQAAKRAQSSLRPLPPLPTSTSTNTNTPTRDRAPTPPVVSVFDFDSDTESVNGDAPAHGFARRVIHGLAHPLRKDKSSNHHPRSASVAAGRMSAISAPSQRSRSRAETMGGERGGDAGQGDVGEGKGDKAWLGRGSSEVFGRILGRWSA